MHQHFNRTVKYPNRVIKLKLTHKHTHFTDKTAGDVYTTSEKALFTVVAKFVYLYFYHLATLPFSWRFSFDKLSKINVINYVKIAMYIQFSIPTWYKILVILSIL